MIFTYWLVIVIDSPFVMSLNQEIVVESKVLKVMNESCNDHWAEVNMIQIQDSHEITPHKEIIHGLTHINSMSFVMVGYVFVPVLHCFSKVVKSVRIYHHLAK